MRVYRAIYFTLISIVIISTFLENGNALKPVVDYFNLCRRRDPEFSRCVRNSLENVRPRLIEGIPDLNIVPLDPLFVSKIEMQEGNGNFQFKMTLSNVTITGLKDYILQDLVFDIDKLFIKIKMLTPDIKFEGLYEMEGRVLVIPLSGKGDCVLSFSDVDTVADVKFKVEKRNDKDYLYVDEFKWSIEAKNASSQFNNLFGGDKQLTEATNRALRENWRELLGTYKHLPEEAFGILFKEMSNRVFSKFSMDELFID